MLSDEGPYLNGTDLAPFPLGFFCAGLQFSFLSRLLEVARSRDVRLDGVRLRTATRYSMTGSFLRGDAVGGAQPAELRVELDTEAGDEIAAALVREAERTCPAQALMRERLENRFGLCLNGDEIPLERLPSRSPVPRGDHDAPGTAGSPGDDIRPDPEADHPDDIITRVEQAEKVDGVEGGAGSSLEPEQKRTLRVQGLAVWPGEEMMMEGEIGLRQPIGSTFRFLCDETPERGGRGQAPPPLAYLAAGLAFCYLTQIGRYAHILGQDLHDYRVVQENAFLQAGEPTGGGRPVAEPVETRLFLSGPMSREVARDLAVTGERTCFLHASMRGAFPSAVHLGGSD